MHQGSDVFAPETKNGCSSSNTLPIGLLPLSSQLPAVFSLRSSASKSAQELETSQSSPQHSIAVLLSETAHKNNHEVVMNR